MKKRDWCYVQKPVCYDVTCDKCGGTNTHWSEYAGMIWCYDCQIDTPGNPGIFDGPIPIELSKMLGISFDRFYLDYNKVVKFEDYQDKTEDEILKMVKGESA